MPADTPLYNPELSHGILSILDRSKYTEGRVWWVAKTAVVAAAQDAVGFGTHPDSPFATLVYAETQASAGDTIYVMPCHTETLASATGAVILLLDVAGLKVIGLGGRTRKPVFLIDGHASNYVSITGADTVIQNLCFQAGEADITSAIIVAGDGVEIRGCVFEESTDNENFKECITDGAANTADRLVIVGCEFDQDDAANTAGIQIDAAQDRIIITDNIFMGDWGTAAISLGEVTLATVARNYIYNVATDIESVIEVAAAGTGICGYNAGGNGAAQANQLTATAMAIVENYMGDISDASGIIDPIETTLGD
jgi:hypothetical protein